MSYLRASSEHILIVRAARARDGPVSLYNPRSRPRGRLCELLPNPGGS